MDYQHLPQGKRAIITKVTGTTCYHTGQLKQKKVAKDGQIRGTGTLERAALLRDVLSHEPVLAARDASHGIVPDRTASLLLAEMIIRNPTLAAAWALAEANPSENLHAMLAAAQAAAAEAEEAA